MYRWISPPGAGLYLKLHPFSDFPNVFFGVFHCLGNYILIDRNCKRDACAPTQAEPSVAGCVLTFRSKRSLSCCLFTTIYFGGLAWHRVDTGAASKMLKLCGWDDDRQVTNCG